MSREGVLDTFEVGSREDQSGRVRRNFQRSLHGAVSNSQTTVPPSLEKLFDLPQKLGTFRVSADSYLITKNFTVTYRIYGVRQPDLKYTVRQANLSS